MRRLFSFPNPVNEVSARLVAGGVVIMCVAAVVLDQTWLIAVIAYGFVARVLTGPTLSPLGQLATRVITPRLPVPAKLVPGPPKRFAQGIGAVLSVSAAVLALGLGLRPAAYVMLILVAVAATPRSGVRVLPRLQDLRRADANRSDPGGGLRAMQRRPGPNRGRGRRLTETTTALPRR